MAQLESYGVSEESFSKIPNDILDHIAKVNLNGTQFAIAIVIWRKTFGFHRESHELSLNYLAGATGRDRRQIKRELDKMIDDKILVVTKEATFSDSRKIGFNRCVNEWSQNSVQYSNKCTGGELVHTTEGEKDHTTGGELVHQERKTKEILKKDSASHEQFFEELWKLYPRKRSKNLVKEAQKKKLEVVGFEKMKAAIDNYKKEIESNKTPEKFILHGGRFFNGRYEEYLDENMEPIEELDPTPKTNDLSQWTD